jgi:hypothetical protein
MFWKVMFWIAVVLLAVTLMGSAMAVAAGGVSCTFNTAIWAGCLKFASGMLLLRIGLPVLVVIGLAKLIIELRNRH